MVNWTPQQIAALIGVPPLSADARLLLRQATVADQRTHLDVYSQAEVDAAVAAGGGGGGYTNAEIDALLAGRAALVHSHVLADITDAGSMAGVNDAPANGSLYGRINNGWAIVPVSLAVSSNLADLQDSSAARGNLGLGDAATKDVGTAAGTVAAGNHQHRTIFPVWAEESGSPSTGTASGYQWSFGNGATGADCRFPLGVDCELSKMSLWVAGSTPSVTVEVYKNGAATGATCSTVSTNSGVSVISPSISFSAGDALSFRTVAVSGSTSSPNTVTAWFETVIS